MAESPVPYCFGKIFEVALNFIRREQRCLFTELHCRQSGTTDKYNISRHNQNSVAFLQTLTITFWEVLEKGFRLVIFPPSLVSTRQTENRDPFEIKRSGSRQLEDLLQTFLVVALLAVEQ